jgi:hypothetical protein
MGSCASGVVDSVKCRADAVFRIGVINDGWVGMDEIGWGGGGTHLYYVCWASHYVNEHGVYGFIFSLCQCVMMHV